MRFEWNVAPASRPPPRCSPVYLTSFSLVFLMVATTIIERRAVESSSLCRVIASLTMVVLVLGARLDAADPTQQRLASAERPQQQPLRFTRDVVPALTKAGCNSGVCHGSFLGRGGLQLSLLGFESK